MFWERFSALCAESGKSPNGVAKELGIPSGSITAWKNGSIPRSATLIKIASYFNVAVSVLTEESGQKEKSPTPDGVGLDDELVMRLCQLTPDEIQKVDAFVQGLLASR